MVASMSGCEEVLVCEGVCDGARWRIYRPGGLSEAEYERRLREAVRQVVVQAARSRSGREQSGNGADIDEPAQ